MDENKFIEVGVFTSKFNIIMDTNIPEGSIYQSKGLPTHMINSGHGKCLKYLDCIREIINNPDYIGKNPNESNSIELIKKYKDNVLIGIKVNTKDNYIYVATMHDVQESKIAQRLHSGRLKIYQDNVDKLGQ